MRVLQHRRLHIQGVAGELTIDGWQRRNLEMAPGRIHEQHRHGGAEVTFQRKARRTTDRPRGGEIIEEGLAQVVQRQVPQVLVQQFAYAHVAIERIRCCLDPHVLELAERHRALEMVGMDQHAILRVHEEGFVRRALKVQREAARVADHQVIRRRLRRAVDRAHGDRDMLGFEQLATNQRQRHPFLRVIAVGGEVISRYRDARCIHAGAGQSARFGKGKDVWAIVTTDPQHHASVGALLAPVPVLPVQETSSRRDLRQQYCAGAAVGLLVWDGDFGRRLGEPEDLGARVHQCDVGQLYARSFGHTAHFLEVQGIEGLDLRQETGGQSPYLLRAGLLCRPSCVERNAAPDSIARLGAVLQAP